MKRYLFIDAGYLELLMLAAFPILTGEKFELESMDYRKVKEFCRADRVFYYNSIDEEKIASENEDQHKKRLERAYARINGIRLLPDFHVRPGSLQGKLDKQKKEQKEVDVQLTVDVLSNVFKKNCDEVHLIAGDLDFRPLIEEVVSLGTRIVVFSSASNTSDQLKYAPDHWRELLLGNLHGFTSDDYRRRFPVPGAMPDGRFNPRNPHYRHIDHGRYQGKLVYLAKHSDYENHEVFIDNGDPLKPGETHRTGIQIVGATEALTRGYCKLFYPIEWTGQPYQFQ